MAMTGTPALVVRWISGGEVRIEELFTGSTKRLVMVHILLKCHGCHHYDESR